MRRLRWTPAQDNQLRALIAQALTWDEIAEAMGRSPAALEHRGRCLGVPRSAAGRLSEAQRRARSLGWPAMEGSPEERERRFLAALAAEARACGLLRADVVPQPTPIAQPLQGDAA